MQQEPREQHWQSLLFILSVLVFSTGVYFYLKNRHTRGIQHTAALPPPALAVQDRQPNSDDQPKDHEEPQASLTEHEHEKEQELNDLKKEISAEDSVEKPAEKPVKLHPKIHKHALAQQKKPYLIDNAPDDCESTDLFLEPDPIFVSKKDWEAVVKEFRDSKRRLLIWLEMNEAKVPRETAELMEFKIKSLKIFGAPWKKEPNLRWGRAGFFMVEKDGSPSLVVSPGFVELAKKDPKRSKFEMTRMVAQTWSPCELERLGGAPIWKELLDCMGLKSDICSTEGYSESGWAVSTVLGDRISPPGCRVPALQEAETKKCTLDLLPDMKVQTEKKSPEKSLEEKKIENKTAGVEK